MKLELKMTEYEKVLAKLVFFRVDTISSAFFHWMKHIFLIETIIVKIGRSISGKLFQILLGRKTSFEHNSFNKTFSQVRVYDGTIEIVFCVGGSNNLHLVESLIMETRSWNFFSSRPQSIQLTNNTICFN